VQQPFALAMRRPTEQHMTKTEDSFFLSAVDASLGYKTLRDSQKLKVQFARRHIEKLWSQYRNHADRNFQSDSALHLEQRFWEMYLYCAFELRGLNPQKIGSAGAEFFIEHQKQRIWIEAVAPGRGSGADAVPEPRKPERFGQAVVNEIDSRATILRYTNAVQTKVTKFQTDIAKGLAKEDDLLLLCLNGDGLDGTWGRSEVPFFVQALLPIGDLQLQLDAETLEVRDSAHLYRSEVHKTNGAAVATDNLLSEKMNRCVGILHSTINSANISEQLGEDFDLLINPRHQQLVDSIDLGWSLRRNVVHTEEGLSLEIQKGNLRNRSL
jgi:hypothetical protein